MENMVAIHRLYLVTNNLKRILYVDYSGCVILIGDLVYLEAFTFHSVTHPGAKAGLTIRESWS